MAKKIKTGLSLPALLVSLPALAEEPEDPRGVTVGPSLGMTVSSIFSPIGYNYFSYYGKPGPRIGIDVGLGLSQFRKKLTDKKRDRGRDVHKFFAPELHYSQFGSRFSSGNSSVRVNYDMLTLPILFRTDYSSASETVRPTFHWGPQLGFKLKGKAEIEYGWGGGYSYDLLYYANYMPPLLLDFGFQFGGGVTLNLPGGQQARFTLRLYQGLAPEIGMGLGFHQQVGLHGAIQF